jgi:ADP-ribose pyrophosphatase
MFAGVHQGAHNPSAPRVAVGGVVIRGGDVLLVRRSKAPSRHLWAVPGGSVELGESLLDAAVREVREETGVDVRARAVVHVFDAIERDAHGRVEHHYVVVDVACDWVAGEPQAGSDALEARWQPIVKLGELTISPETLRLVLRLAKRRT